MTTAAINWCLAIFLALILALGSALGPDDMHSEWAAANALADAQKEAALQHRIELAAFAICRETHGEAVPSWTAEGQLVCKPRRNDAVVAKK